MHLVPYVMHMALYVLNTTRSAAREEKNVMNYLKLTPDKWIESALAVEGGMYWSMLMIHTLDRPQWEAHRKPLLARLLVQAHIRKVAPNGRVSVADKAAKDYSVYKPYLAWFALLDGMYKTFYKTLSVDAGSTWSQSLAEFIRQNDTSLQENAGKLLSLFEEEVLPCESLDEFCDVVGLLEDIPNPSSFLTETLAQIP